MIAFIVLFALVIIVELLYIRFAKCGHKPFTFTKHCNYYHRDMKCSNCKKYFWNRIKKCEARERWLK